MTTVHGLDGDRLIAARNLRGLRSCQALVDFLKERGVGRGYGYDKLARIESGEKRLAPQDADFIARHLEIPRSFFTAPIGRLGDTRSGEVVMPSVSEDLASLADEALAALDAASQLTPARSSQASQRSRRTKRA